MKSILKTSTWPWPGFSIRWGCYLDKQWQKYQFSRPESYWYNSRSLPEHWITWKVLLDTWNGYSGFGKPSSICRLPWSSFDDRHWWVLAWWTSLLGPIGLIISQSEVVNIGSWLWGYWDPNNLRIGKSCRLASQQKR